MLLRVLTVLAAGAGLAKPVLTPSRGPEARVILVDVSRSARDSIGIRDSVRAIYKDGDAVVLFDSSARIVIGNVADTLGTLGPTAKRGNLSAALVTALRAGSSLRDRADRLDLVIVSPFAKEELDAATDSIRTLWPGRARLVRAGAPPTDTAAVAGKAEISLEANDPLRVTAALARVRVVGNGQRETGSGQRATGNGQPVPEIVIDWPTSSRPRFAVEREKRDTVGGVLAGESTVISTFERVWRFPPDSLRGADVIARWVDGEPAAIETPAAAGCVRSVAIPVSPVGDLVIRKDVVRLMTSLAQPCAATTSLTPAESKAVAKLEGRPGLAPRQAFQPLTDADSALAPWLLALALAAAIAELFVRRRSKDASALGAGAERSTTGEARAA